MLGPPLPYQEQSHEPKTTKKDGQYENGRACLHAREGRTLGITTKAQSMVAKRQGRDHVGLVCLEELSLLVQDLHTLTAALGGEADEKRLPTIDGLQRNKYRYIDIKKYLYIYINMYI